MLKKIKNTGFASIVEIVVTAVIFTITSFGILVTITAFRDKGGTSSRRLDAAYAAKGLLDEWRFEVNHTAWISGTGPLAPGGPYTITSGIFTIDYLVTDIPGSEVRRVDMNVIYPD